MNDFFNFKRLITTQIIGFIYVIGFLGISAGSLIAMFSDSGEAFAAGLLGLTIGNVVWRIICESSIVLFNIHDKIADLHDALHDILHAIEDLQGTVEQLDNSGTDDDLVE